MIKKGKVKNIYESGDGEILFEFSNRVSCFDVILPSEIPYKGEVLCRLGEFFFKTLDFPNHMIKTIKPNEMVVKKLNIIPMECVVRNYLYGSLFERVKAGEIELPMKPILAAKLPKPIFDPTTKFEKKDRPITKEEVIEKGWLDEKKYGWLEENSIKLYEKIANIADKAGFIIADIKFEFGMDGDGKIFLADSIGPDEFRMWSKEKYEPGKTQESFDKQVVRDWLIKVGYKDALDKARKAGQNIPEPPKLDNQIIKKTSDIYIYVFETLTGEKFK